jgi:hypothetical protein
MNRLRIPQAVALAFMVLATARHLGAQSPPPVDLSGMWLVQDPGSGSWTDWFFNAVSLPKPDLHPSVVAENAKLAELEAKGEVVNRAPRRLDCPTGSVAMMMASSSPLNIVQGKTELLMGAEAGRGRAIALDGRSLPDPASPAFVATGAGYSVGHWEGDELVVETIGFATDVCDSRRPSGGAAPGGGRVRQTTRLTERYRMEGDMLTVRFTWVDPTVYLTPYTYTYTYKKLPLAEPFEN